MACMSSFLKFFSSPHSLILDLYCLILVRQSFSLNVHKVETQKVVSYDARNPYLSSIDFIVASRVKPSIS